MERKEITIEKFNSLDDCEVLSHDLITWRKGFKLVKINKRYTRVAFLHGVEPLQILYRNSEVRPSFEKSKGLYQKYFIEKTDGSPINPHAKYFVLRYDNNIHARKALKTYADSVKDENPLLSEDLLNEIK